MFNWKISKVQKIIITYWLSLGGIWLILEIASYLGFTILQNLKWYGVAGFGILGLLITIIILVRSGNIVIEFDFEKPIRTKYKVIDDIHDAHEKRKFDTVIRLGNGLSRTLYLEGHYRLRYDIGVLVEDAASKLGDIEAKCAALIDCIGWSLVLSKSVDNSKAKNYINHGISIAKNEQNNYWVAKGIRHLAAIDIIDDNFQDAIDKLNQAIEYANNITDINEKNEMIAGINYDYSFAYFYLKDFTEATKYCKISRQIREQRGDKSRICRMYALEGKIEEAQKNLSLAKDIYRKGLLFAEEVNRKDEIIRNHLGLARVLKNEDLKKAKEHLKIAQELSRDEIDFDIYGKEEIPLL